MKCPFKTEIETKVWLCQLAASPHLLVWKAKKGPFLLLNWDICFFPIRQSYTSFLLPPTPQENIPSCCWPVLAVRQLTAWITQGSIVSLQDPATQSGIRAHCWALPAHQVLSWSWKSRDNRQLFSKHSLLSLSKYKPTPNQLLKQPKVMGNLYSLTQPLTAKGSCPLFFVQVLEIKATAKLLAAWETFQFHFYC